MAKDLESQFEKEQVKSLVRGLPWNKERIYGKIEIRVNGVVRNLVAAG